MYWQSGDSGESGWVIRVTKNSDNENYYPKLTRKKEYYKIRVPGFGYLDIPEYPMYVSLLFPLFVSFVRHTCLQTVARGVGDEGADGRLQLSHVRWRVVPEQGVGQSDSGRQVPWEVRPHGTRWLAAVMPCNGDGRGPWASRSVGGMRRRGLAEGVRGTGSGSQGHGF